MKNIKRLKWAVALLIFALCATNSYAGNDAWADAAADYDDCGGLSGDGSAVGCIEFQFVTGPMKNQVNVPQGRLGVMSELPSPTVSTPQAIKVVTGLYGIQRVVSNEVVVLNNTGSKITFAFSAGSAEASPVEQYSTWNASLKKVDAQGVPTTNSPAYYDLYTFKGLERVRFDADTNSVNYLRMVNLRTDEGQVYEAGDFGMSYIYDEEGVIRQVMAPTRFLDIVVYDEFKYQVRFYKPEDVSSSVNTNGLYEPLTGANPFEYWTIENPNRTNSNYQINVSRTVGGTTRTRVFTYTEAQNTWAATRDNGETFEQSTMEWDDAQVNCVRTKSFYSDGEAPVQKAIKRLTKQSWGQALMSVEDMVSATNSRTRTFTYYSDESQTGRYSQIESIIEADGSWQVRNYDALGRGTVTVSSWKDVALTTNAASARAVYTDYTPHEAADVPLEFDERPRTVTETVEGIVTKKTFYTYKTNSVGAQVHITEQCDSPSGSYGDAGNLRTVKTYYPPYSGSSFQDRLNQGRIKTIEYPDGTLKTYEYALGDLTINTTSPASSSFTVNTNGLDWRVTVINGTTNSPSGIVGETVKQVTVKDRYSNDALTETYVYTGSAYERINWTAKQFDVYGHAAETWYADGTQDSGVWGSGCCGQDSGTERDGTEFAYTYDLNTRLISATRLTTNGTSGFTIETSYDAADRKTGTSKYAPGITPLTTQTGFDMIGRPVRQELEDDTVKTWVYDDANRVITAVKPGGAAVVTAMYLDGRVKQQTGTAKVNSAYDYGVNADGTQWTTEYTGPDGTNSPVWQKITTDLLGRPVKIEKPGFGGSTLLTEMTYNSAGKVEKTVQSDSSGLSAPRTMLYAYNALGEPVRTALDLNSNGQQDLTDDRITEEETFYQKISNEWYRVAENRIYPEDGSSSILTTAVKRVRLTGLGTQSAIGNLTSEIISIDRFGNQTVTRKYTDRANKTVSVVTDVPDSTTDEVSVTVNRTLQSETSQTGVTTAYQYDSLTRLIGKFQVSSFTSQVSRTVGATIHYNNKGQVDWQEDAASNRTWFAYDSGTGLKTAVTNALGQTTLYEYNDRGDIAVVGGSSQYPVEYGYDDVGRMTDLYTLRGATNGWDRTQWLYDQATGLVTNKLHADGHGPSYSYTPDGKLATRTWARMVGSSRLATHYYYDSIGQLTNTVYSDGTPSIAIAYNRLGQKTQVIDASGTNTFAYSDMLQLTNETQQSSFSLHRSYDSLGRSAGYDLQSQASSLQSVAYGYDDLGRFSSVSSSVASVSSVVDYSRLDGSDLISGYTTDTGLSVSYGFEDNRNAKTAVLNEFGTNLVSRFDYTYDPLMRRTQRIDDGSVTNDFGYNSRSELTAAQMGTNDYTYAYDQIGNRTSATNNNQLTTYSANALNQYTNIVNGSTNAPTYDADGNLLTYNGWTYSWNGENRLVQASNATTVVVFKYDAQGRRFEKIVNATNTTRFVYDNWNLISEVELNLQSQIVNRKSYVWGLDLSQTLQGAGGVGGLLFQTTINSTTTNRCFAAYDANGNITEYVSTNGTVAAHYEYDPYGNITKVSGLKSNAFSHRFSTKPFEAETGLIHYQFRSYIPELGRWLCRDPMQEKGGVNLYAFCGNSPVNFVDPLGLEWFGDGTAGIVGREDSWVEPGEGNLGGWLEEHIPAMETMGKIHDPTVGILVPNLGGPENDTLTEKIIDGIVNVPTMPVAYVAAVATETAKSVADLFKDAFNALTGGGGKKPCP